MTRKEIKVAYFNIPVDSLENVVMAWKISRSEDTIGEIMGGLNDLVLDGHLNGNADINNLLADILQQDLPIREFVPVFFVVENAPRSFVDQLDRHRVGFAFWEQSLRVKDLTQKFDYYVPEILDKFPHVAEIYHNIMGESEKAYKTLVNEGIPREMARGVVPLHIEVRLSVQCNLRSLLNMLKGRMCYFAQGTYWKPVVEGLLEGLWKAIPKLKDKKILKLPCTGQQDCPFRKDIMDRLDDESNPICPILINDFIDSYDEKQRITSEMIRRYPKYTEESEKYMQLVGYIARNA